LSTSHRTVPDVVIAPNCLRGYACAADVAIALARGVRQVWPDLQPVSLPLADGGDGTLDVLQGARGGTRHAVEVADLFGRPRKTEWLALDQRAAVVETAAICGLGALRPDELRPLRATSAGVGQTIAAAVAAGATTVLLGLGGTAVVDGGAGAVDLSTARRLLSGVTLELLADVRTPLAGNLDSFGAQKGVTADNRPAAVRALRHLARLLAEAGVPRAQERFRAHWFGAGGGIGFGLSAVAATRAGSGAKAVLAAGDPGETVATARLALTAEGAVDSGTWEGKLPGAVVALREERGLPTAVIALRFTGPSPGPLATSHLIAGPAPVGPVTGAALLLGLKAAAAEACRIWSTRPPQRGSVTS